MKSTELFNFVIARRWEKEENQLNCYTYHNTVFYGDMKDARNTLAFIRGRADENTAHEFEIYKIGDEPLK
jgi:hypothetical protein